jgi:hypothetical protein
MFVMLSGIGREIVCGMLLSGLSAFGVWSIKKGD